jgi:hypothetical protein
LVPPAEIFVLPPEASSDEDPPLGAPLLVEPTPPKLPPDSVDTEGPSPIELELGIIEDAIFADILDVAEPTVSAMFDIEFIIPTVLSTCPCPIFITVGVPIASPQGELFLNLLNKLSDHV